MMHINVKAVYPHIVAIKTQLRLRELVHPQQPKYGAILNPQSAISEWPTVSDVN